MTTQAPARTADEPIGTVIGLYDQIDAIIKLTLVINHRSQLGGAFQKEARPARRFDIVGRLTAVEERVTDTTAGEVLHSTVVIGGRKIILDWAKSTARDGVAVIGEFEGTLDAVYVDTVRPAATVAHA